MRSPRIPNRPHPCNRRSRYLLRLRSFRWRWSRQSRHRSCSPCCRIRPRCRYTGTYSARCSAMRHCMRLQNMCLLNSKYSRRNLLRRCLYRIPPLRCSCHSGLSECMFRNNRSMMTCTRSGSRFRRRCLCSPLRHCTIDKSPRSPFRLHKPDYCKYNCYTTHSRIGHRR
jgi:hypothetical protein